MASRRRRAGWPLATAAVLAAAGISLCGNERVYDVALEDVLAGRARGRPLESRFAPPFHREPAASAKLRHPEALGVRTERTYLFGLLVAAESTPLPEIKIETLPERPPR